MPLWLVLSASNIAVWAGSVQSSVVLQSTPNPSIFGQSVTLTATLTPADATGKVTFYDGITILGTVSVTGQTATLDTIFLPAGNRSLRAYYAGDATYAPATSAIPAHVVNVRPSATFAPAAGSPIQAGFEPAGVAISDFNGDGKADIAIANFADSTVSVLLGTGTGTFSPANGSPLRSGTSPVSIGAADFNGDGNTDLAIVNYGSQDLTVLLGDGSGNFSEATGSPVSIGNSPLSLVIADFDRDGKADLAIVRDWDSSIAILLGDGLGGFTQAPESPLSMGGRFLTFSAADLNDDGNADLLVTNLANGTVSILLGNGSGGFTNAPGSPIAVVGGPAALVVADFNLDGRADFALATNVSGIWTSLGNGDASFVKKLTSVPPMVMPFAMSINDVNADGKPDVIAVDHNGGITVLTGDAVGGLAVAPGSPIPVEAQPTNGVAFADFNGDGRADIVATVKSNSDVQVLLGRGLLSSVNLAAVTNPVEYGQAVTLSATVEPSSATGSVVFYDGVTPLGSATVNNGTATLDVNSILSGRRALRAFYVGDVTYAGSASNVIIEAVNATPSTTLAATTAGPVATGSGAAAIATADFNRDGYLDAATVNAGTANVSVLLGDGAGGFTASSGSPFGVGAGANSIATADFNLDGAPDLAVANSADNTVSLLFGNGQGGFTAAAGSPFAVGIAPQAVAIGDFNGDGRPDLVVIDAGESKITTLLNTGAENMTAVSGRVLLAAGPYSTAVGDYDGDGIADLAVTSASNNGVSIFFGIGSGTFSQTVFMQYAVGVNPVAVITADLNGDGILDLVIVNTGSNNVTVLLGVKGNGHFTVNGSYAVGGAPQSVTMGDYNGDGRVDLFVANGQDNTITVLLGDGNGGFTQAKGSPFPAGAGPGSISSGDFNHDGKTDVAVVNSGSDNVSVLLGAGVVSSTTLSVLPATSILGAPVSLTAMVNPQATGGVTFYDGVTPLGGAWLDHGLAIFQTSMLSSGVHNLWAYYRGDTTYPPSRSVTVRQVVNTNTVAGFVRGSADGLNVYSSPHGVEQADFNRDGQADLVVATDNDVRIYLGDGHGGFAFQSTPVIDDLAPEAIAVADFDGDGNQDIAIAIKYGRIGIFLGDGRGAFHVATGSPIQITNVASSLAVGDFNQDGIVDLVLGTNESGTVLLGKGRGEFLPPVALDVSPSQDYIGIADFDGDGKADLAVLNTGSVNVLFGNGSGQFTAPQSSLFGIPYATSVTVGDVNGDGAPDLAITSLNETLSVAFSRGTEDFNYTDPVMLASGSLPGASRIADVKGDGKPDLIVENHQTNDVSILLGDGQGGFTPVKTWALRVGSNPVSLAVGDLNGDGREDLIVANGVSTNISVLLGTVPTPLGFYPLTPCRVADTRDVGKAGGFGPPPLNAGATRDFPIAASDCGVPACAQAYALNATVVPHGPLGYLSLCSSGQPFPTVSTLNSPDGSVTANAAIVPAGSSGAITALVTNEADLVLDINGYFGPPTGSELSFYPVTPCRVVDTRATNKGALFGSPTMAGGEQRDFPISQSACGIPSTAQAYALNFTVVPQSPLGYLSAWPTGKPFPVVSTLNSPKGSVVANAAIVPAGDNGAIRVLATAPSDLIIDVNGYFAPPSMNGIRFYALAPCRVVDTRFGFGSLLGPALAPGATRDFPIASSTCGVPPSAQAYSLNITAVPRGFLGYLSVWPAGSPFPIVSTLNSYQGLVVADAAIVPAGVNGAVSVLASDMTDLVIDINGYFAP